MSIYPNRGTQFTWEQMPEYVAQGGWFYVINGFFDGWDRPMNGNDMEIRPLWMFKNYIEAIL